MSLTKMKVAIDCDDCAKELKAIIIAYLRDEKGINIVDLDYAGRANSALYPEIGYHLATKIQNGEFDRGILLCGTGIGMAIIANKVEGVYACVCHDVYSAERLCKSNNAQVLTMGSRVIGPELAKMIVDSWLGSEFTAGPSTPKVEQIKELEHQSFHPDSNVQGR